MKANKWTGIVAAIALTTSLVGCSSSDEAVSGELLIWDTGILGKDVSDDPYADKAFLNQKT
jgi:hypothetical protein